MSEQTDNNLADFERLGNKLYCNGFDSVSVHFGRAPYIVKMNKEDEPYPDGTESEKWTLRALLKHYLGPVGTGEEEVYVLEWEKEFRHLADICKRYLKAINRR